MVDVTNFFVVGCVYSFLVTFLTSLSFSTGIDVYCRDQGVVIKNSYRTDFIVSILSVVLMLTSSSLKSSFSFV